MDYDKAKRRQNLKVIFSEILMFLAVVVTVIILAFIVSGYWINENFEVERQGMLQVSSTPTGADVIIDDSSSWLQKTNTSKVLSAGEHTVVIKKEGYDSWSKTINISEGLLYRLHYPRLFPLQREKKVIYDAINASKAFLSDNHEKLLLYSGDVDILDTSVFSDATILSPKDDAITLSDWVLFELNSRDLKPKPVNIRTLYDFFKPSEPEESYSVEDFKLEDQLNGTESLIISKFYEDYYLTVINDSQVILYKKGDSKSLSQFQLSFTPTDTFVGHGGEFIVMSSGTQIATLDMEARKINEWSVEGDSFDWLDNDMIYSIVEGELIVYDYDGLNRRIIAKNVSNRFPVTIVKDEWLYYFSDDNLIRDNLRTS